MWLFSYRLPVRLRLLVYGRAYFLCTLWYFIPVYFSNVDLRLRHHGSPSAAAMWDIYRDIDARTFSHHNARELGR